MLLTVTFCFFFSYFFLIWNIRSMVEEAREKLDDLANEIRGNDPSCGDVRGRVLELVRGENHGPKD